MENSSQIKANMNNLQINTKKMNELLEDLVEKYCKNSASIFFSVDEKKGVFFSVNPKLSSAAQMSFRLSADWDGIDACFGQGTISELSFGGKQFTKYTGVEELRQLCLSVVNGNFEETIWRHKEEILKVEGRFKIDNEIIRLNYTKLFFNPFLKKTKQYFKYISYKG